MIIKIPEGESCTGLDFTCSQFRLSWCVLWGIHLAWRIRTGWEKCYHCRNKEQIILEYADENKTE